MCCTVCLLHWQITSCIFGEWNFGSTDTNLGDQLSPMSRGYVAAERTHCSFVSLLNMTVVGRHVAYNQWRIQGCAAGVGHVPPLACLPSKILVTCANEK